MSDLKLPDGMHAVTGMTLGKQICDALGIDPNQVHKLIITFEPRNLVRIRAEYYATETMLTSVREVLDSATFGLVRFDSDPDLIRFDK